MTLSVMQIGQLLPSGRGVPRVCVAARADVETDTHGVQARDLDMLLGMLSLQAHEVAPFRVAARNRAALNPDEIVGARAFGAMRDEAIRRGMPEVADVFTGLASLAASGEMDRILAGERTASVRQATATEMRRLGKSQFDIGDTVLSKANPELGRGVVVDFSDDGSNPIVQWNSIQAVEEKPGDLVRTATKPAPAPSRQDDFDQWFGQFLAESRRPAEDPYRRALRAASPAVSAADMVRRKLAACGMHVPPEIATIAFITDPDPHGHSEVPTGRARVLVRARSQGGAHLDLEIPVPFQGDDFLEPDLFSFGGFDYELTPASIQNLLAHYSGSALPHLVTPFQAAPFPIMDLPRPPSDGVFASPPDLPARYPGI